MRDKWKGNRCVLNNYALHRGCLVERERTNGEKTKERKKKQKMGRKKERLVLPSTFFFSYLPCFSLLLDLMMRSLLTWPLAACSSGYLHGTHTHTHAHTHIKTWVLAKADNSRQTHTTHNTYITTYITIYHIQAA